MTYYLIYCHSDHDYAVIGSTNGQSTDFFTYWQRSITNVLLAPSADPVENHWSPPATLLARHTLITTSTDFRLTHPELFL